MNIKHYNEMSTNPLLLHIIELLMPYMRKSERKREGKKEKESGENRKR